MEHLIVGISDAALTAASDTVGGQVELPPQRKFVDSRVAALLTAVNAERVAGFPSGRLFLYSVEQASPWRWSVVMRSGACHRGYTEVD